jgi:hypothetical protein
MYGKSNCLQKCQSHGPAIERDMIESFQTLSLPFAGQAKEILQALRRAAVTARRALVVLAVVR